MRAVGGVMVDDGVKPHIYQIMLRDQWRSRRAYNQIITVITDNIFLLTVIKILRGVKHPLKYGFPITLSRHGLRTQTLGEVAGVKQPYFG